MSVPITYNIRNLIERKATTLMTALGIGLTVAVLVTAMALVAGLDSVFAGSGDARQVLVLRKGVNAELSSTVSGDTYQIIRRLPGIATDASGEPMVSPEALTVVNLPSVDSPEGMNVSVRGMLPIGLSMRTFKIEQGSMFSPGLRQVVVGQSIARRYPDAQIGKKVKFGRGMWEVVGVFSAGESASNSEIWADLNQLRGDFEQEGGSSSLLVRMNISVADAQKELEAAEKVAAAENRKRDALISAGKKPEEVPPVDPPLPAMMAALRKTVADDQRLGSDVMSEKAYYASMTSSGDVLKYLGYGVSVIMAIGSAFAATNTMYAAVSRRTREIGTLRALGFGRGAILRSFMLESIFLAFVGGVLGILITLPINGMSTAVGSFVTFSEVAFKFRIGWDAIAYGLIFAVLIGVVGGFLPAYAASKRGIVAAMRDL
ncbi:MAG TPA: ABC transporter permease [Humisphaera sp.]|jgi:ABC-type antimicrobial peptide transport system permease subunit|nr:ABC transporter permease [Humisphaera sp.]